MIRSFLFSTFLILTGLWAFSGFEAFAAIDEGGGFSDEKLQIIDRASLAAKIRDKKENKYDFTLIDTRSESDFQKSHIPGAVNLPFKKHRFLAEAHVPTDEDVVCYGYSSAIPSDVNAAIYLMNHGYAHVWFFKEGMTGWSSGAKDDPDEKIPTVVPPSEILVSK